MFCCTQHGHIIIYISAHACYRPIEYYWCDGVRGSSRAGLYKPLLGPGGDVGSACSYYMWIVILYW